MEMEEERKEFEDQIPERERIGRRKRGVSILQGFRWKYLLYLLYAGVGLVVLVLLLDKVIMPLYTKHGREYTMPDVVGRKLEDAQAILKAHHLRPIVDKKVFSTEYPAGTVISQNPIPGSIVKSGRRTYLAVSKGTKLVEVPNLIGGSERDAEIKLRQSGLVPGEKSYEFSSFYPKGVVIAQSVPVGDSIAFGDTVDFVISLGEIPENLTVPNLVGKSLQEAKQILLKMGLQVGMVTYQVNNDLLPETVIHQSVPPDSVVDVGTPIDLVVSVVEPGNSGSPPPEGAPQNGRREKPEGAPRE